MPGFNIKFSQRCDESEKIPNASTNPYGANNLIETVRTYRYVLEVFEPFGTKDDGILLYLNKCSRPSVEIDEIVIHNGQDQIFRPGKNRWNPIELTFYDILNTPQGPYGDLAFDESQTASMMFELWASKTINLINSGINNPSDFCSDMQLDLLDGVGRPVWIYNIYRAWPTKITSSDLSYANNSISEISATMRFDKAEEKSL